MLWASWTTLVQLSLVFATVVLCISREHRPARRSLIAGTGFVVLCWIVAPERSSQVSAALRALCLTVIATFELDRLAVNNAAMIVTGAALVWLLRRAVQTLWKPVPELISILGVEVPAPPDVSLTAIGVDKATVTWTRPPSNRPVHKFVIQVNGVNVGESATNQDTFITVSGLKPNHFYNVRIIAVGSNHFQAGSRVLRLRTFGEDGRPRLGTSRLPSGFAENSLPARQVDMVDENGVANKPLVATFGTATGPEGASTAPREGGSSTTTTSTPRRNTVGRRHSPSTTSLDKLPIQDDPRDPSAAQMAELNQRYLSLRKDTEDTVGAIAKEEEETRQLLEELESEKKEKRKEQKKKEEQTEKLKREQGTTDRSMRSALQRKSQKERLLKEKRAELAKVYEGMAKWDKGIADMRKEQESYEKQKSELVDERDEKGGTLRDGNSGLRDECSHLENQLKEIRQRVKDLQDARKELPGSEDDAGWRESMIELRRDWQRKDIQFRQELIQESRRQQKLDEYIHELNQLRQIGQSSYNFAYDHANSSGFDFDSGAMGQVKRRSRNSISHSNPSVPSPIQAYPGLDPAVSSMGFGSTQASAPTGFVTGPYMGFSADGPEPDEAGLKALSADAPLSPSATDHWLPSGIFADDDVPSSSLQPLRVSPLVPTGSTAVENDPQSPSSSSRSMSILSSRQGSSNNLPFAQYSGEASERRSSKGPLSPPITAPGQAAGTRLGNLFSFPRSRAGKTLEEDGPALGSLKHGQSQSFPRQDEDMAIKARRISLSSWNVFNRNSAGPEILEGHLAPTSKGGFSARNLLPFGSKTASSILAEGDQGNPRPASIVSIDMARPSTDSGSIWGPPGEGAALGKQTRLWSPDTAWSRNPSRRPSIHGSPSALKTNLASAEDEILDEAALLNPQVSPSQVGVIGSRPPASKKSLARTLNPTAPTFMTNLFRPKPDKDKEKEGGRDKEKGKGRGKGKGVDAAPATPMAPSITVDESPSESRISRDALSVHTQTSVSESRESLSLDHSLSHTTSEPGGGSIVGGVKDPDSAFRKLFRKDSTSKLSFSQKFKRSKGPGSVTNSEKAMSASAERSSMGDFDDAGDEGGGGGSNGPGKGGFDSVTSSPSLGPSRSARDKPESKLKSSASWFSIKKKNRDKESLELERDRVSEAEMTGEEGK